MKELAAAFAHTCVRGTSEVYCWGWGGSGRLGDNDLSQHTPPYPVRVVGIAGTPTKLVNGESQSCIVNSNGNAQCWGSNTYGELGDGTTTHSATAVLVKGVGGTGSLSGVSSVSSGQYFSCALASGGVYCWGDNASGRLGTGNLTSSTTPVQVTGAGGIGTLSGVTQISSSTASSCARKSDGTVWCWGKTAFGMLGTNQETYYLGDPGCSKGWCGFTWSPQQMQQRDVFVR